MTLPLSSASCGGQTKGVSSVARSINEEIRRFLDEQGVVYRTVQHEPTLTSEQSAQARGEDIRIGGKALLMKIGEVYRLFVLSAARKLDSDVLKRHFGVKKCRFASAEELLDFTGLTPGAVPPFGFPILPFELYVDKSILLNDRIAFNAGSLTDSVIMSVGDYLRIADATVLDFSQ